MRWPINGDVPLSAPEKVLYMALNAVRNARPYANVPSALAIRDFACTEPAPLQALRGTPSPSRALSDLFWQALPWADIGQTLSAIRVFDIGCGSGAFGARLREWSGGRLAGYRGLDVKEHPHWVELAGAEPGYSFLVGDAQRIGEAIPKHTTLVTSQSALEHVPDDGRCFEGLAGFVKRVGHPVLQVHLVPSQACLWLYGRHGFRQYTPRTLAPVVRLFEPTSEIALIRLGGKACTSLHAAAITRGRMRETDPGGYRAALERAIVRDCGSGNGRHPSPAFYALLIWSNGARGLLSRGSWI